MGSLVSFVQHTFGDRPEPAASHTEGGERGVNTATAAATATL